MGQVAHICYEGGALLLPAQDPYDREVVFEEAEFCARRHGGVGVDLGGREMRIRLSAAGVDVPCQDCRGPVGLLSFHIERRVFCSACAKRCMGCPARTH